MSLPAEIQPGQRVRVTIYANGYHRRNFTGRVMQWTKNGLIKVMEDGKDKSNNYSSEHVRLIKQ